MAKRRKVLAFHSWLNLAVEDVFLGRLGLFVSAVMLSKFLFLFFGYFRKFLQVTNT